MSISRYDLEQGGGYDAGGASMVAHPMGDYVAFADHDEIVSDLQSTIGRLQKAVNEAANLLGEVVA